MSSNLEDEPSSANDSPGTRAEMTCIPRHKTWQMNLLWLMDPQYQSRDDLHSSTQNLADESILADGPPWYQSRDDLHTTTQNLADEPTSADGPSWESSIDVWNTATPNLADKLTSANGPPR